jgi:hypothetical protein
MKQAPQENAQKEIINLKEYADSVPSEKMANKPIRQIFDPNQQKLIKINFKSSHATAVKSQVTAIRRKYRTLVTPGNTVSKDHYCIYPILVQMHLKRINTTRTKTDSCHQSF